MNEADIEISFDIRSFKSYLMSLKKTQVPIYQ